MMIPIPSPESCVGLTDLLRSKVISNGILETFANALLGDGIEIAFGKDRVDGIDKLIAGFR